MPRGPMKGHGAGSGRATTLSSTYPDNTGQDRWDTCVPDACPHSRKTCAEKESGPQRKHLRRVG